jgi:hypothetical protein
LTVGADLGIFIVCIGARLIGAQAGVGGGIIVVPALTILFGVDDRDKLERGGRPRRRPDDRYAVRDVPRTRQTSGAIAGALLPAVAARRGVPKLDL